MNLWSDSMNAIIESLIQYKYLFIAFFSLVLIIVILLIVLKPKKIKSIETTIDDVVEEKSDIEKVIEALEENKNERVMTSFEEEQEANAIISYQELVKAVQEKKLGGTVKKIESEVPQELLTIEEDLQSEEIENNEEIKENKFKNSEFISPVFGKDSNNDKFLKDLKDFRNNL